MGTMNNFRAIDMPSKDGKLATPEVAPAAPEVKEPKVSTKKAPKAAEAPTVAPEVVAAEEVVVEAEVEVEQAPEESAPEAE